jgi:hypothetical protein
MPQFLDRLCAVFLSGSLLLVGCGDSVEQNTTLDELDASEAKETVRALSAGVWTAAESDCVMDAMLNRPGVTVGEVVAYAKAPDPSSPLASVYEEVVPTCIDPTAVVEPRPLAPELRAVFINSVKASDPSVTDEQAACLLDGLLEGGLTPRELSLASYDDELFKSKVEPLATAVGPGCF